MSFGPVVVPQANMARVSASSTAVSEATGHASARTAPISSPLPPGGLNGNEDDTDNPTAPLSHTQEEDERDRLPEIDPDVEDVIDTHPLPMDESLYPGGSRDLSYIGLQAFALGSIFAGGASLAILLARHESPWWRLPTFFAVLALFHFLEFWTQARYNTPATRAESFLLFSNGKAYNIAHGCATLELIAGCVFPRYGRAYVVPLTIALGLGLIVVGQAVRSIAMAQAGVSFNHIVAREKKETHKLVTHGLYSVFRHPSYFGFFWWAVGTQFLVGNKVCLVGYAVVLWSFFRQRIRGMHWAVRCCFSFLLTSK
jgi:protein-S-isoprenylcysteine O-methyltransferase